MKTKIIFIIVILVVTIVLTNYESARAATWTQKADMPTARWTHSSAVVDGKIYVIGGVASEPSWLNGEPISAVEEYDPATDTWTRKTDMPEPRGYLDSPSPVVDGKIYVIGGGKTSTARVDVYDPATDTWSRASDMPTPRLELAQVAFGGKIYAFGGITGTLGGSISVRNITEVYDPQTDTWTEAAPMRQAVWGHSADEIDGKIYVVGGASWVDAMGLLQVYDPQTDTWVYGTSMPISTRGHATSVICGKIYAFGGWLNSRQNPYSYTWVYDPASDIWSETVPLPDPRATLSTSFVNGRIYAIGGTARPHDCQATSTVYELSLDPPPDFNGDGVVNGADAAILVDHWHTDDPSFDIAPGPCGDGIVDTQDLLVLAESIGKEVQDSTLAAHWSLDETDGMYAADSVGENDAILMGGATWQPDGGQKDGALQLDGLSGYAMTDAVLNPADGPFSIIAWIKGGAPGQVIVSQQTAANWLTTDTDGKLMTELKSSDPTAGPLISKTVITDGQWHRIGLVWDGSHRMLYVDGVAVAEDTQPDLDGSTMGLYFGVDKNYTAGTFFSGLIDDVRIYKRAVSP